MPESILNVDFKDLANYVSRLIGEDDSVTYSASSDYVQRAVSKGYSWFLTPSITGQAFHRWSFLRKTTTIITSAAWTVNSGVTVTVTDTTTCTATSDVFTEGHVGKAIAITDSSADTILSVTSSTICVLTTGGNTAAKTFTLAAPSSYALPDDFESFITDLTSPDGTNRVPIIAETDLHAIAAQTSSTGVPLYASYRVSAGPTGTANVSQRYEFLFHPVFGDNLYITWTYGYWIYPAFVSVPDDGDAAYGGPQHSQTLIEACLAVAEIDIQDRKGEHWDRFQEMLASSIEFDKIHARRDSTRPFPISQASSTHDHLFLDIKREAIHEAGFGWDTNALSHDEDESIKYWIGRGEKQFYWPPRLEGSSHEWRFLRPIMSLDLWQSIAHSYDKTAVTVTISGTTATASSAIFTSDMVGEYICYHDSGSGVPTKITAFTSSTVVTVADSLSVSTLTFTVSPYWFTGASSTITVGDSQTPFFASMVGKTISYYDKTGTAATAIISGYTSTSVLTVSASISVSGGAGFAITADGLYRLPSNFSGIVGPVTHQRESGDVHFTMLVDNEVNLRRLHQAYPDQTGEPQRCAVRPVQTDGTVQYASGSTAVSQAWDFLTFPLSDELYTVEFQFNQIPLRLTTAVKYPAGGPVHHETLLASVLAIVEMETKGEKGKRWEYFMERLGASIDQDRRSITAENLGHNSDHSGSRSRGRPLNYHGQNNQLVTIE